MVSGFNLGLSACARIILWRRHRAVIEQSRPGVTDDGHWCETVVAPPALFSVFLTALLVGKSEHLNVTLVHSIRVQCGENGNGLQRRLFHRINHRLTEA